MRYRFIHAHRDQWSVRRMCKLLRVGKSSFHNWVNKPNSRRYERDQRYAEIVRNTFEEYRGTYGAPRITVTLRALGHRVSEPYVARLMREMGLVARQARKRKPKTTVSDKNTPPFPDLIQRDFSASEANRRWVGDMTYLRTAEGFEYLATVIDLYSRRVVGWALGHNMEAELVVNALKMACVNRRPPAGVIFHSDRGGQYNSELFKTFCVDHEGIQSMGRTGSCYDNAAAESFFHSLKVEWLHGHEFTTRQAVRTAVFEYIETFYNANRRHSTLGYLSPSAFEKRHQQEEADEASRHHAPPRSAAQRASDQNAGSHSSDAVTGTSNTEFRQSGRQQGAQPRHHPGSSFPLAPQYYT